MKNNFLKRIEKTTLAEWFGRGRNLRMAVMEILAGYPQDQSDENFRRLLREILETESGVVGEEIARNKMRVKNRNRIERD